MKIFVGMIKGTKLMPFMFSFSSFLFAYVEYKLKQKNISLFNLILNTKPHFLYLNHLNPIDIGNKH